MNFKQAFLTASVLVSALVSGAAHASLISGTSSIGGTVTDTTTGSEWLQLDVTAGLSAQSAAAQYAAEGFALATQTQLDTLISDFFAAYGGDNGARAGGSGAFSVAVSLNDERAWNTLFGLTYLDGSFTESLGWYTGGWFGFNSDPATFKLAESPGTNFDIGSFLVKTSAQSDVPEPASLALVGLSLLGLAGARRLRKN